MIDENLNATELAKTLAKLLSSNNEWWLEAEISILVLANPRLLKVCSKAPKSKIRELINQFFDGERAWDSAIAITAASLINKMSHEKYKTLSINDLLGAGLTIELAIYALAYTKYSSNDEYQKYHCPLKPVFLLNAQNRTSVDPVQQDLEGGNNSDIEEEKTKKNTVNNTDIRKFIRSKKLQNPSNKSKPSLD